MNAQFRKTTDKAIVALVDPTRGYVYTCLRCSKHIKEEGVAGHICETETLTVQGVNYVRDASMRYACQICAVAVPIVLVRAHALRHPRPPVQLEEEEWLQFTIFPANTPVTLVPPLVISDSVVTSDLLVTGRKRRRDCSEVLQMLRKVRKVGLTLERSTRVFSRALAVAQKRVFRRWTKLLAIN